ncbi:MAG: class I SAM-dependent methyltransferase [Candidatus Saelkia tenebricola]|nr:class I SAM-dependent methyltransferase [Candidatus Saelkia tenebricola]
MEKAVVENHKRYLERIALYKSFGYDIEKERKFVIENAEPLYGDILEVGTGKGYLTVALAKEGYEFSSVDISEQEQEFAQLNIKYFGLEKQVDFRIENAEQLSFEDGYFDIIFSANMTHHLTNTFKVIDEFIRIISLEGKIILSDFNEEGLKLVDKIHISEGNRHQSSEIMLVQIKDYLVDKGFRTTQYTSEFQDMLIASHQLI